MSLRNRIPDPQVLISLAPEELAPQLLSAIGPGRPDVSQGQVNRDQISRFAHEYPHLHQAEVEIAITEAWRWLEIHIFLVPAPGSNGQNGWFVLGRRGRAALEKPELFVSYRKAAEFPRELLHPAIAERYGRRLLVETTRMPCSIPFELSRRRCGRRVNTLQLISV